MKIKDLLLKTLDIYERGLEDFKENKNFKILVQKNLEFGLCNCFAGNVKVVNYAYFMKKENYCLSILIQTNLLTHNIQNLHCILNGEMEQIMSVMMLGGGVQA